MESSTKECHPYGESDSRITWRASSLFLSVSETDARKVAIIWMRVFTFIFINNRRFFYYFYIRFNYFYFK